MSTPTPSSAAPSQAPARPAPQPRSAYRAFRSISTRWADNDVYGRINIGNAPPPPLIYAEPVIIHRPAVVVPRAPIYLYVPPGHAKNWGKHCGRYNACNQPVYFVQEPPPRRGPPPRAHGRDDRRWDDDHRHGGKHDRDQDRGRGHGNGKGHGNRD